VELYLPSPYMRSWLGQVQVHAAPFSRQVTPSTLLDRFGQYSAGQTHTELYGQLHDQLNHCHLSKRVSSTVMLLSCIWKVCSSNLGRRTDSTDVSRGFTQPFLEIRPGHLLLYHSAFILGDLPPNVLSFQLFPSSLNNNCG
jgi:hypothetical protein